MNYYFTRIRQLILKTDRAVLDFLYPPRCPVCDRAVLPKEGICRECLGKLPFVSGPVCMKCGKPVSNDRKEFCRDCEKKAHGFAQGKALWIYEKEIKASIYRFKYQNKREYGRAYAEQIAARHGAWIKSKRIQALVPVPLHKNRKRKRGYNQAEILARELGKMLGIPVHSGFLIRMQDTKPQKTLNDEERRHNLKHAFQGKKGFVPGRVLLVDDIYTTGSTLDAAAAALSDAGAEKVYAYCLSIGGDS